jgi:hypothetical protein
VGVIHECRFECATALLAVTNTQNEDMEEAAGE